MLVISRNNNLNNKAAHSKTSNTHQNGNGGISRTSGAEALRQGEASACHPRWTRSGGHHPVEAEGGIGVDPRRGDGGVWPVRGGGVPLPDANVLRGHDRHAHLLHMDQRLRVPQPAGSKDTGDAPVGEDDEAGDPGPAQAAQLGRAQALRHRLRAGPQDVHPYGGVSVHRVGVRQLLQLPHAALPRGGVRDDGAGAVRAVRAGGGPAGGARLARPPRPPRQDGLRRAQEDPQRERGYYYYYH